LFIVAVFGVHQQWSLSIDARRLVNTQPPRKPTRAPKILNSVCGSFIKICLYVFTRIFEVVPDFNRREDSV